MSLSQKRRAKRKKSRERKGSVWEVRVGWVEAPAEEEPRGGEDHRGHLSDVWLPAPVCSVLQVAPVVQPQESSRLRFFPLLCWMSDPVPRLGSGEEAAATRMDINRVILEGCRHSQHLTPGKPILWRAPASPPCPAPAVRLRPFPALLWWEEFSSECHRAPASVLPSTRAHKFFESSHSVDPESVFYCGDSHLQ